MAGGPSLNTTLHELDQFRDRIMVAGSAHDHVVELGYRPRYAVIIDPEPGITASYLSRPQPDCTYLVATQCHDDVFDALNECPVAMWHCAIDDCFDLFDGPFVGGGCTVTLRAMSIAIMLGYGNQHLFGFDSCVSDKCHAYPLNSENEITQEPISIRIPGSDREFWCPPYLLAQTQQFQEMIKICWKVFCPTVHGDGLIAEIMKVAAEKERELA